MSYATAVLALSPTQFLQLQEASGATATDASGNGNHGTYGAGASYQQASLLSGEPSDYSIAVGGTTGINSSLNPFAAGASQTWAGWAVRSSTAADHTLMSSGGVVHGADLYANSGSESVTFESNTSQVGVTWAAALPVAGTPFHWALVYKDATRNAEFFVNGISLGAQTEGFGYFTPDPGGTQEWGAWSGAQRWPGRISHVAVWSVALTSAQILDLYQAGSTVSSIGIMLPLGPIVRGRFA